MIAYVHTFEFRLQGLDDDGADLFGFAAEDDGEWVGHFV